MFTNLTCPLPQIQNIQKLFYVITLHYSLPLSLSVGIKLKLILLISPYIKVTIIFKYHKLIVTIVTRNFKTFSNVT